MKWARVLLKAAGAAGVAVAAVLVASDGGAGSRGVRGDDPVMAEMEGEAITADAVDRALGYRGYELKRRLYQLRRQKLDALIEEKLLQREATGRGISVQRLLEEELKDNVRITDQEVDAFYRGHKTSIQGGEAAAREPIRKYLEKQKRAERRSRLIERLKARAQVRDYLEPPSPNSLEYLVVPGASFKGPRNVPVTIVEFSDFQCPFCGKAQPVLQRILDTYPHEVRLVYRHFPLKRHPYARFAAEAAECAAAQGKFWKYHDQVFENASRLSEKRLKTIVQELGLDTQAFEQCLDAGTAQTRVAKDLADGREAGVTGTPTFFINGRMVEGVPPFATFKRIIDRELALRRRSHSAPR